MSDKGARSPVLHTQGWLDKRLHREGLLLAEFEYFKIQLNSFESNSHALYRKFASFRGLTESLKPIDAY